MALDGGEGSVSCPGRSLPPGKDPVPIVQEAGWAQGPVWTGAENLDPTGIRPPDRPASNQSLNRLSYLGPLWLRVIETYFFKEKSSHMRTRCVRARHVPT